MHESHFIPAAAYVVLEDADGRICLLRRTNTGWQDGKYGLISGKLDGNESPREAAVREAREEAGIETQVEDMEFFHVEHLRQNPAEPGGIEYIYFFFRCRKWQGEVRNMEPDKCDDIFWATPDNLPENVVPEILHALPLGFTGIRYGER